MVRSVRAEQPGRPNNRPGYRGQPRSLVAVDVAAVDRAVEGLTCTRLDRQLAVQQGMAETEARHVLRTPVVDQRERREPHQPEKPALEAWPSPRHRQGPAYAPLTPPHAVRD